MQFADEQNINLISMDQPDSSPDKLAKQNRLQNLLIESMSSSQIIGLGLKASAELSDRAFDFNRIPRRPLAFSSVFTILGLIFLINSMETFFSGKTSRGFYYLGLALLLMLPGVFYLGVCVRIGLEKDENEREIILDKYQLNNE